MRDPSNSGSAQRVAAGFTVTNLKEIEDSLAGSGTGIEARFARRHLDSEHLGVTYIRYAPGFRAPMGHSHREQEELYIVVSGSGRIKLDDEVVSLGKWDVVRVASRTVRALEGGASGLELIAVGSDRPNGGDVIRAPDWWTG